MALLSFFELENKRMSKLEKNIPYYKQIIADTNDEKG